MNPRPAPVSFRNADLESELKTRVNTMSASQGLIAARDLQRYYTMLKHALKTVNLERNEALLLCDVSNGTIWDVSTVKLLYAQVEDSLEDGYAEKWDVDAPALIAKLRKLNGFQCLAVVDAIERWWNLEIQDHDERLKIVGLVI